MNIFKQSGNHLEELNPSCSVHPGIFAGTISIIFLLLETEGWEWCNGCDPQQSTAIPVYKSERISKIFVLLLINLQYMDNAPGICVSMIILSYVELEEYDTHLWNTFSVV